MKTSPSFWQNHLREWKKSEVNHQLRLALLGVGQELRGDDFAGSALARLLKTLLEPRPDLLILDTGAVPENFTAPLRRFQPDLILFVDAAQMNARPGTIHWIELQETGGMSVASHAMPLSILAGFLSNELNCRMAILGIQPAQNELGKLLSPQVEHAVNNLAQSLSEIL
jgi:hydrogenase 3 maturation protease